MFGVPCDVGIHKSIPKAAWNALEISHKARTGFVADPPPGRSTLVDAVTPASAEVLQIWLPMDNAATAAKRRSGNKPSKLNATIAYIRDTYPDGQIPHSVKNEFDCGSRSAFTRKP